MGASRQNSPDASNESTAKKTDANRSNYLEDRTRFGERVETPVIFLATIGAACLVCTVVGHFLPGEAGKAFRKLGIDVLGLLEQLKENS